MPRVYSAIVMLCTPLPVVMATSLDQSGMPTMWFTPALRVCTQRSPGAGARVSGSNVPMSTSVSGRSRAVSSARVLGPCISIRSRGETARKRAICSPVRRREHRT